MFRDTLRSIIREACASANVEPEDRDRLVATAGGIDRVAVGTFTAENCGCPATLAGYWTPLTQGWREGTPEAVQRFPSAFDSRIPSAVTTEDSHGDEYVEVTD